jgi:hypothetical protein
MSKKNFNNPENRRLFALYVLGRTVAQPVIDVLSSFIPYIYEQAQKMYDSAAPDSSGDSQRETAILLIADKISHGRLGKKDNPEGLNVKDYKNFIKLQLSSISKMLPAPEDTKEDKKSDSGREVKGDKKSDSGREVKGDKKSDSGREVKEKPKETPNEQIRRLKRENDELIFAIQQSYEDEIKKNKKIGKKKIQEMKAKNAEKINKLQNDLIKKIDDIMAITQTLATSTDVAQSTQITLENIKNAQSDLSQELERKYGMRREINDIKFSQPSMEGKIQGLGLSTDQIRNLRQIIESQAGVNYADAFEMIAGEDIKRSELIDGLLGIALSMAIPIPSPILTRIAGLARLKLEEYFDITVDGENRILSITPENANKLKKKKNLKSNIVNGAITGATVGAIAGRIAGNGISTVIGGSAGALIGGVTEAIAGSEIPQIAQTITQKIVDATPNLPSLEGLSRAVQRQITTGEIEVPNTRFNVDGMIKTIPTLRQTTDEEKALVPFDEKIERMSKEKSLGLISGGIAGGLIKNAFFREEPIKLPKKLEVESPIIEGDILQEQQDKIEKMQGKGLLRPKFIIPNVNILQPSDQELAADALEYAAFDFVKPGTEGGEGDLNTNILKRIQYENNNIRFNGAGVKVNSLFGYDLSVEPPQETINNLFLYKALPPLKFQEQEYNLSEFEVTSYDPINQRGAIEMFSPYNDFSDTIPDDKNEMDMSILFSIAP